MRLTALLFLLASYPAWAQSTADPLVTKFENGLVPSVLVKAESTAANITERMRARKVNGASIAIIDKGRIAWAKGYGSRNAAEVVDTATLFQCASIGKIVTSLAALQLVNKGLITLNEDINQKLRSWKLPDNEFTEQKKVTLRHLLTHSSGLTDNYGFKGYRPGSNIPNLLQILNAQSPANNNKSLAVAATPGTTERYSGGGFMIIQQLIEDLTGMPFHRYVDSVIFKPFGMVHSSYAFHPESISANIAFAHNDDGKPYRQFNYKLYPEQAAAGFWTTATDLARLVLAIQQMAGGQSNFLDKILVDDMLKPQINSMGLGMHVKGDMKPVGFWHAGNNEGYTGILMASIETGQGAVVLTNSNQGEWLAMEIMRSAAATYQWPINLSIHPQIASNPAEYRGVYPAGGDNSFNVDADNKGLYFTTNGRGRKYYLHQTEKDQFRIEEKPDNFLLIFRRNDSGVIDGVLIYQNAGSKADLPRKN